MRRTEREKRTEKAQRASKMVERLEDYLIKEREKKDSQLEKLMSESAESVDAKAKGKRSHQEQILQSLKQSWHQQLQMREEERELQKREEQREVQVHHTCWGMPYAPVSL